MNPSTLLTDHHRQSRPTTQAWQRPERLRAEQWCDETTSGFRLRAEHRSGNTVVVRVAGALDVVTTPRLALLLQPRLDCAATTLILDLSRVDFVGTAALGLLLHTRHRAAQRGMTLRLVDGPACLHRALHAAERLGTDSFETYPDLAAACGQDAAGVGVGR